MQLLATVCIGDYWCSVVETYLPHDKEHPEGDYFHQYELHFRDLLSGETAVVIADGEDAAIKMFAAGLLHDDYGDPVETRPWHMLLCEKLGEHAARFMKPPTNFVSREDTANMMTKRLKRRFGRNGE